MVTVGDARRRDAAGEDLVLIVPHDLGETTCKIVGGLRGMD